MPGSVGGLLAGGRLGTATVRHVAGRAARGRPKVGGQQPAVGLSVGPEPWRRPNH